LPVEVVDPGYLLQKPIRLAHATEHPGQFSGQLFLQTEQFPEKHFADASAALVMPDGFCLAVYQFRFARSGKQPVEDR
jgi:hypothetical protein